MLKLIKKYLHRGQDRSVLAALQTTTTTTTNNISRKKRENVETKGQEEAQTMEDNNSSRILRPWNQKEKKSESSRWASVFFFGSFTACYVSITNATRPWLPESYLLSTTLSTREVHKFGFFYCVTPSDFSNIRRRLNGGNGENGGKSRAVRRWTDLATEPADVQRSRDRREKWAKYGNAAVKT